MPAQARYEVLIPASNGLQGLGQEDVAGAALKHVGDTLRPSYVTIDRSREVYSETGAQYFDVVEIVADESPQVDSTLKQLGVYVADVTGHSPILVSKQGKGGIQIWHMQYKGNGTGPS